MGKGAASRITIRLIALPLSSVYFRLIALGRYREQAVYLIESMSGNRLSINCKIKILRLALGTVSRTRHCLSASVEMSTVAVASAGFLSERRVVSESCTGICGAAMIQFVFFER
jgi:hypothetical protein